MFTSLKGAFTLKMDAAVPSETLVHI